MGNLKPRTTYKIAKYDADEFFRDAGVDSDNLEGWRATALNELGDYMHIRYSSPGGCTCRYKASDYTPYTPKKRSKLLSALLDGIGGNNG